MTREWGSSILGCTRVYRDPGWVLCPGLVVFQWGEPCRWEVLAVVVEWELWVVGFAIKFLSSFPWSVAKDLGRTCRGEDRLRRTLSHIT